MTSFADLRLKIYHAFEQRERPPSVVYETLLKATGCDAFRFTDQDWRLLTWDQWQSVPDAIIEFTPDAFVYFLPSVLILSASRPTDWLWPADTVIGTLDRSPNPDYWDDFLLDRFLKLKEAECGVLSDWLLYLGTHAKEPSAYWSDSLGRAFDTTILLRERIVRLPATD